MFKRFSHAARLSVVRAQDAARARNHDQITPAHLLLGLIEEGSGETSLASLGVSAESVREQVDEAIGRGDDAPGDHIPFAPEAKAVMELALRETLAMGWEEIGPEHLLLSLAEGEGDAARVLRGFGVTGTSVMRLLLGRTERSPEAEESWEGPACPSCGAEVAVTAVHRRLTVPAEQEGEVRQIDVVFCRRCSRTLGVLPIA